MKFVATLITLLITLSPSLTVWADAAESAPVAGDKPFVLIARLHALPNTSGEVLRLSEAADEAVKASEPGMLLHTFDQDPDDPLRFVWSEVYKNDDALLAHLANPALGVYLEAHADLGTDFSVEFYGTVGDKVIEAMNGTGVPYKIFKTKLGYSRV